MKTKLDFDETNHPSGGEIKRKNGTKLFFIDRQKRAKMQEVKKRINPIPQKGAMGKLQATIKSEIER